MQPCEGTITADAPRGSVVLPPLLEDAPACPELVGRILGRQVTTGDTVTLADMQLHRDPECYPFYEYIDRPGALDRIVDLDHRTFEERGFDFSDAAWNESNFRMQLPGKAELSLVAEVNGEFAGYCIASEPFPGEVHGHRLVVEPRWRTGRLPVQLWCAQWRRAASNPRIHAMSGEVATDNRVMRRFLESLGFELLDAARTRDYLDRRGRDERLEGVEIVGQEGARSIVMAMWLRERA